MTEDSQLLARYLREKSQDAFAELVQRHLDLVYSAALRQVRSPQLAEEISQSVFTDLARDAHKLKPGTVLTAWLYQVARHTAIDVIRRESRRQARERLAAEMTAMNTASDWTQIEPLLDEAIDTLDETDRTAVLLRYFDNKSLRDVGQALGISDDAAQKRVSRAVERLREFFSKHGVTIGAASLVVIISANAVHAAPAGLAVAISASAILAGAAVQTSTTVAAGKAIALTTTQKTLFGILVAGALAAPIVTYCHAESKLRAQEANLRRGAEQLAQLENVRSSGATSQDNAPTPTADGQSEELLKLRAKVTSLQSRILELSSANTNRPLSREETLASMRQLYLDRVQWLKDFFVANPSEQVPELQYLTDDGWQRVVNNDRIFNNPDHSRLLGSVRTRAQFDFATKTLKPALEKFLENNQWQFPTNTSQLAEYCSPQVDNRTLEGWTRLIISNFCGETALFGITQKRPVNAAEDQRILIDESQVHIGHLTNDWLESKTRP